MIYVIELVIALAIGLAAWVVLAFIFSEERAVRRRLNQMTKYQQQEVMAAEPTLRPFTERVLAPAGQAIADFARSITPKSYRERGRHRLVLAGSPKQWSGDRVLVIQFLLAAAVLLFSIALSVIQGASVRVWLLGMVFAVVAFFGPDAIIGMRISQRQTAIRRALPDMLDMLTVSVEAGLGFDQGISKLVRNSEGPLAQEFGRMLQEVQAGVDRSQALRSLAERTEVPELSAFITAIVQADVFGISIANVLRTQAAEMRLKRRQYAEESAQKAPVKMVFPLILCILPATLIVIMGPAVVTIGRAFGLL